MAKPKKRKNVLQSDKTIKSVNFFGHPNKNKADIFRKAQDKYAEIMNRFTELLTENDTYYWQILNNQTHSSELRALEKANRCTELGSVLSQNAFDDVVNKLYNRELSIKSEVNSVVYNDFTKSITLYFCATMDYSKQQTIQLLSKFLKQSIEYYKKLKQPTENHLKKILYYCKLKRLLYSMSFDEFNRIKEEVIFWKKSFSLEYKIPYFKKPYMRIDSRCCKLLDSTEVFESALNIKLPYVLNISNPFVRGKKITVPLNTSENVIRRLSQHKAANSFNIRLLDNGYLRVIGSVEKRVFLEPEADIYIGGDVGITDALHISDGKSFGTFSDIIKFYLDKVQPKEGEKSTLRNKLKKIKHFYKKHKKNLSDKVKQKLITKMNNLNKMIQANKIAKRLNNRYHAMLDKRIKDAITSYIKYIKSSPNSKKIITILERLDIKDFKGNKQSNAVRSTFARGLFQKRLLETLSWYGFKFAEIDPTYTSQVCPICFNLDKNNRSNKVFTCTCCGFTGDSDYIGSINIKDRVVNEDLRAIEAKYPYSRTKRKISFKEYFDNKNAEYLKKCA